MRDCGKPAGSLNSLPMSTLAEIEAAVAGLPLDQQKILYAQLAQRLEQMERNGEPMATHSGERSRRGFPISRGRAEFGAEDVARIEAGG